ncbi:MAG TPA: hypothetical protein PKZ89_05770 [Alphaproteobacteria bacterium]|nr:hypothetical protein [Alphaproteobacteria bacterium]
MNIVKQLTLFSQVSFLACIVYAGDISAASFETSMTDYHLYLNGQAVSLVSDQDGSGFAYYNLNGTGNVVLGDVAGGTNDSNIVKFSNNLSVVAGNGTDAVGMRAFVWTSCGGLLPLGLVGGHTTSEAWDISADGSTIVGSLLGGSGQEAFRWTSGSGTVALGLLAGGSFS